MALRIIAPYTSRRKASRDFSGAAKRATSCTEPKNAAFAKIDDGEGLSTSLSCAVVTVDVNACVPCTRRRSGSK